MIIQLMLTSIFFTLVISQYIADRVMKPDVTFGEQNDRFDVTSIIDEQNRFYDINKDYRRNPKRNNNNNNNIKVLGGTAKKNSETKEDNVINALGSVFKSMRRSETDFAYHDTMRDEDNGNIADFEENLEKFKREGEAKKRLEDIVTELHDGEEFSGRRSQGALLENEVLLHYAFPVLMKVNGYLQVPLTS